MLLKSHEVLLVKDASPCMHNIRNQQESTGAACLFGLQAMRYHAKREFRLEKRLWIVKGGTGQKVPVFNL